MPSNSANDFALRDQCGNLQIARLAQTKAALSRIAGGNNDKPLFLAERLDGSISLGVQQISGYSHGNNLDKFFRYLRCFGDPPDQIVTRDTASDPFTYIDRYRNSSDLPRYAVYSLENGSYDLHQSVYVEIAGEPVYVPLSALSHSLLGRLIYKSQ